MDEGKRWRDFNLLPNNYSDTEASNLLLFPDWRTMFRHFAVIAQKEILLCYSVCTQTSLQCMYPDTRLTAQSTNVSHLFS